MSDTIATYSFLPWLRQGLANKIEANASENGRAVVKVDLQLKGEGGPEGDKQEPVSRNIALFGPGDIQGIDQRAVFRVEPRDWSTNFEPNYFPAIEFYDEDFCWRYSPVLPDGQKRLMPWLALVVLEDRGVESPNDVEFKEGTDVRNKPLPYVEVTDFSLFPPANELWAWAHVHVNRSLAANADEFVSTDMNAVLPRLRTVLGENPDLAYSRIVAPRKLAPNKAYHAFLMPAYESGRRAGLGLEPFVDPALPAVNTSAWVDYAGRPEPQRYPYYYRWRFRTGGEGDFESLVRLLKPRPVDNRVGRRNVDAQFPGSNVRGVQEGRDDLAGVLKLGGALRVPEENFKKPEELAEYLKYETWATPFPQPIQEDLATLINLADDYAAQAADAANQAADILDVDDPTKGDPDPVITAPLYGTWHAMQKRLLVARDGTDLPNQTNWVHELNLDPRFRVAAGFGTKVVQDQQEKYMDAAWDQLGKVLEANARIRRAQAAIGVSGIWYDRHLQPLIGVSRQNALLLMAPMNKRVLVDGSTVHQHYLESRLQPTMTSGVLRRIIRPRGRLMQSLPFDGAHRPGDLLDRVNQGEVSAAPPKVTPPGVKTVADVAEAIEPKTVPSWLRDLLRRYPWIVWIPLVVAALIILLLLLFVRFSVALPVIIAVAVVAFWIFLWLWRLLQILKGVDALSDESPPPGSVDDLPTVPGWEITDVGSGYVPSTGTVDSQEAIDFKDALKDIYILLEASEQAGAVPPKKTLDLDEIVEGIFVGIDPAKTIPRRVLGTILIPPRIRMEMGEQFVEAMAYPEFDTPMYEPLKNISSELFLPNIGLIPENSVTLLETNQRFIESYMVGLNHEFGRELLWREYPTDQRGSYFRQFWDPGSYMDTQGLDAEALREKLRDIPRLDKWPRASKLGGHDHRQSGGQAKEEVVLVIRGELLKRYPNAVIYAHRACWQRKAVTPADQNKYPCDRSGDIDVTVERRLVALTAAEEANPPHAKVRTPLYEARVSPDIFFFGFDLETAEARGGTGQPGDQDPGWFFVIKERPAEPRFGLDIDKAPQLQIWNDLSWEDLQPGAPGSWITLANIPPKQLTAPPAADEKFVQYEDDVKVLWNASLNSSDLAYMTFQAPVLVAFHASEMLAK
ncbi:MAG TPA: hypothetical protein VFP80_03950 [Thermoanaerobaculia bacterium]|nr:hypothetical protein [Thermoanaerobaculia bacterium]